jgi:hypothetical protein
MSVKVSFAKGSYSMKIDDAHRLDLTIYIGDVLTEIHTSVWEEGNSQALGFYNAVYFNWGRILPVKWAEKMCRKQLKKHQRKLNEILERNGYNLEINFLKDDFE